MNNENIITESIMDWSHYMSWEVKDLSILCIYYKIGIALKLTHDKIFYIRYLLFKLHVYFLFLIPLMKNNKWNRKTKSNIKKNRANFIMAYFYYLVNRLTVCYFSTDLYNKSRYNIYYFIFWIRYNNIEFATIFITFLIMMDVYIR